MKANHVVAAIGYARQAGLEQNDITSKLDGEYHFEPSGDDTEVVYHLVAELKVPIPGFVKRRAQGRIMNIALRNLKSRVEANATNPSA